MSEEIDLLKLVCLRLEEAGIAYMLIRVELDGTQIWIVSPEDLIISKLFWTKDSFSELQLKDIKNLWASIKNLDEKYIGDWIQKLELNTVYERIPI